MHLTKSRWFMLVFVTAFMLWTLAACGGSDDNTPLPADEPTAQATVAVENTPTPTAVAPTATPVPATPSPVPTDTPAADATTGDDSTGVSTMPDAPLPEDATDVTYEFDEVVFSSASDVETLVTFYREALSTDGWQELDDFSMVDDTFAYVEFDRDDETISITVFSAGDSSETTIDLSNAPSLAGNASDDGVGFTIADWPTPPDATNVEVSGDTLSFTVPLSLTEVAEFYRPTYESMDLGTSCLDDVADYTSVSCSFSNGDITVSFFAYEGFDGTEVEIQVINYALEASVDSGELGVEEEDGLPLPDDYSGYSSESSDFLQTLTFTSPSSVEALVTFMQTELAGRGWTEEDFDQIGDGVTLSFSGPDGQLIVTLQAGDETEVVMTRRDRTAAEEAGILPPAGQARLYLVNFSTDELTVVIDGQTIQVPPEAGMESPDDAPTLDLAPGTYDVTTTVGGSSVTDEITIGADETWALLLDEMGALPLQMY